MKGHVEEKANVSDKIEIDVSIEELEHRTWPRPALTSEVEKRPLTETSAVMILRRRAYFWRRNNAADQSDRSAA
jgi:hypothetical protein